MDNASRTYLPPTVFRLLLLLLAAVVVVGKTAEVMSIFTSPTDENLFQDTPEGVRIMHVTPGGVSDQAGIRVGDILTAINNQTFQNAREANAILKRTKPGDVLSYTIRRGSETLVLNVTIARVGIDWAILLSLLVMAMAVLVALFVGLLRPQLKGAQLLSLSLLLLSPVFVITGLGKGGLGGVLWWTGTFLAVPLSLHASLHYPAPKRQVAAQVRCVQAAYFISFSIWLALVLVRPSALVFIGVSSIYAASMAALAREIVVRHDAETQRFQQWIWRAFGLFALSYHIGWLLFVLFGREFLYVLLLSVAVPVAYFYSITKYRFFGITRIMKRGLTYNIALAALILLIAVLSLNTIAFLVSLHFEHQISVKFSPVSVKIFIDQQMPAGNKEGERFLYIAFGALLTVVCWLLLRQSKRMLDKWFYRQEYNYKRALTELSEILAEKITSEELAESLCKEIVKYMQLKGAAIFLLEKGRYRLAFAEGSCKSLTTRNISILNLHEFDLQFPQPISEFLSPDSPSALQLLQEADVQLLVPLLIKQKPVGMILLAEKRSEEIYKEDDVHFIDSLAKQAAVAFENARLNREASDKRRLKRELEFAQKVQQELLPRLSEDTPIAANLRIATAYFSVGEVGGDYYDVLYDKPTPSSEPESLMVLVGDVAGKGISAAMYMSRVQGIVRTLYHGGLRAPKALLEQLNTMLFSKDARRAFVTMICARFTPKAKTLDVARAGHLPMIWYSAHEKKVHVVKPSGIAIGLDSGKIFAHALQTETIHYDERDIFAFFSDGVTEARNKDGEEFGMERLMELIARHATHSASYLRATIESELIDFVGTSDRFDDITLLIIKAEPITTAPPLENSAHPSTSEPLPAQLSGLPND
ncbi:MAG: SpoIIE family protein phosphatase [Chloroherpetonaceae bacterium]|nr:SpoIIE family protein phosphatase [Chloroherpetonaceae bacterium]MDW8466630.1 SpoIIE family protein phosphatase [Chloroherpetonaceae bacterium]